ncbi:MAG: DNA recombination protein RmuC [Saprospiraceae bacterium]|nr:DNA recombination protein RmuC [Candidatus Brachybacter algidus]MBL0121053.1 DNA recombination protein RmuC [Candidatus Brachybacter algidus]
MIIDQNTVLLCLSFLLFGANNHLFLVKASHVPRADFNTERDKSLLSANEQLNLKTRMEEQNIQLIKASEIFSNEQQITRQQQNRISELSARQESNLENLAIQSQTIHKQQELLEENQQQLNKLLSEISKLEAYNDGLHEKLETNKSEVEEIRKKSLLEFESVANKLLEEKTAKFSLSNKESMEQILNPLKENIVDFKKKVEETYDRESKERFSLEARIKELVTLNNQISKDANNLTNALKGQAKTQGNWGEMILENILEYSGLVKNREYFLQESYTDEAGRRKQPDVIIKYPGDRHIIVDSKVSLTAYERFANEEDVEAQKLYLAEHIRSIKSHIDGLSLKEYDNGKIP